MTDEKQVIVFESAEIVELELAKSLLDKAGIPCALRGGSATAYLTAALGAAFGGVQTIVVAPGDEERAVAVLEAAWGARDAEGEGESESEA